MRYVVFAQTLLAVIFFFSLIIVGFPSPTLNVYAAISYAILILPAFEMAAWKLGKIEPRALIAASITLTTVLLYFRLS